MEYVAFDLETTGLDPERDRVIEVGAVVFDERRVNGRLQQVVDPGRAVPEAILRLTGISPDELAGAPSPEAVLRDLAELLRGRTPVGHGVRLDVDFMAAAGLWPAGLEVLDTLEVARILLPDSPGHGLSTLVAQLGLDQPHPHRALDDADATRQLLLRLRQLAAALPQELKDSMLSLSAPYQWPLARFFTDALAGASLPHQRPPRRAQGPELPRPRASGNRPDDDPKALAELLGPQGPLARDLPGYEHRESQLQMLLAVAQVMRRGGTLVVEAGTGTGKSLAYLVPAAARAVTHGERVVISTHTHTLQEQLTERDIPALRRWLPWDFSSCLLKGRPNYVSLRRWRQYAAEPCQSSAELAFKLKVAHWLHRTRTGDRAELRLQGPEEALWARICSDPLDCVGFQCSESDCFVHRARARAERADLVVVNHALLVADAETGGGLLPHFEHLVVDEAHHLEDAATQGLRRELDVAALNALLERLASEQSPGRRLGLIEDVRRQPRLGSSLDALEEAWPAATAGRRLVEKLFEALGAWLPSLLPQDSARAEEAIRLTPKLRAGEDWSALADLASDATTALGALDAHLRRAVALSREWLGGEEPDQALRELEAVRARLAEAAGLIQEAFAQPDPNCIYWLALSGRSRAVVLRSAPLDVGELLRERVFAQRSSLVLTSASLAVAGSLDYFCSRTGVGAGAERLLLPSPFDYLEQSLVCLPTDMPEPEAEEFEPLVEEIIADLARRLEGRTLALFTSHQQLRRVYAALKNRRDLDQVLILGQGLDGQRRQLLEAFQERERPLLMGTASLWEGIDVPGERLSCVVIVRLPFPVPTEPVYAARAERLRDPFRQYALPMAALRLKQGFGRLIRRRDDRGAVVILDGRILARDYGRAFLEALPRSSRFLGPAALVGQRVQAWLAGSVPPSP